MAKIDMIRIVGMLANCRIPAYMEHTGGGVGTIFIGEAFRDEFGDERFPLVAGPGDYATGTADSDDFYVGPDYDGSDDFNLSFEDDVTDEQVFNQILALWTAKTGTKSEGIRG